MSEARQPGRRWWMFALWLATIALVWALLGERTFPATNDRDSAKLLFGAACVIAVSVLIMLVETPRWTLRRIGVFGLILFDCLFYGLSGSITLWHWTRLGQGELDGLRAILLVSAPILLVSQLRYLAARLRAARQERNVK